MRRWSARNYKKRTVPTVEACMTEQEIIDKTNKVFEESFEIEKERLVPQAHIFTDLGLDSLDIVDLVVALQNSFGVKIRNEEGVRDIRTLQDIYQFISAIKNEEIKKST
jgi:acyl carrier protein